MVGRIAVIRRAVTVTAVAALWGCAVLSSCASGDDDTLQPLPADGTTGVATSEAASAPTVPVVGGPPTTVTGGSSTTPTTTTPTTTTVARAPSGDWDGVRFDVGTIDTVSELDSYQAIGFDRYTLNDPQLGTVDAAGFQSEPVRAWWQESPFANVRVQLRTFVLDPDVEVLVLDESDRAAACVTAPSSTATPGSSTTSAPSTTPARPAFAASWLPADVGVLADPARSGGLATLTYSDAGLVTRIRFTHGC